MREPVRDSIVSIVLRLSLIFGLSLVTSQIMLSTIVLMIVLDVMHPPAVATSLSFGLKAGNDNNLVIFALAVGITALLVVVQRFALWFLASYSKKSP